MLLAQQVQKKYAANKSGASKNNASGQTFNANADEANKESADPGNNGEKRYSAKGTGPSIWDSILGPGAAANFKKAAGGRGNGGGAGQMPAIPKAPKWFKRVFIPLLVIVALIVLVLTIAANLGTDILWFSQLGFGNVLFVQYVAPVAIFLVGFISATLLSWLSLLLVWKLRATYQVAKFTASDIDKLKQEVSKHKNRWFAGFSSILGILFGLQLSSGTQDFLLLFGSNSFGETDPIFHNDISLYVFMLPGLEGILTGLICLFALMLILAFVAGSVFGQVQTTPKRFKFGNFKVIRVAKPLRAQLSVYAFIISIFVAISVWLSQYDLLINTGKRITGATWTDVNVQIPVIQFCSILCIVVALLFLVTAFSGKIKFALGSIGVVVIIGVLAGGVAPIVVQNLVVAPNEQEKEKDYISDNIYATQKAFGIDNVDVQAYNATTDAKTGQLQSDAETTTQIRLLDPQIVAPTFRQIQQNKQYYSFPDALSVDKYKIGDKTHDTVIAARELDLTGSDQRNWVNDHTVFTHGFGVVAAYGNSVGDDGKPQFFEKDIPTEGAISKEESYEPRIYFSKNAPQYSIVGAPDGKAWEFDYPEAQNNVVFDGQGGPMIDNAFTKLMYAIKFNDYQLFFTDRVNENSQILYDRDPAERVQKVAPYLELDGRVYPAVVDGRVKWIIDAYTTTDRYPYSKMINLANATKDTITETSKSVSSLESQSANYIRNSVKATVDAYDGTITLYAWDPEDPILKAWSKIYGQNLHPISEISSDLMSHIRYPENLFKIQRSLLETYHITNPTAFFSGEDFWQTPQDPTTSGTVKTASGQTESNVKQPPYYLTLQMPGNDTPTFSLTSSYIPGGGSKREILTGFLSADSDAGNEAGVIGANYGRLHLLELPKNTTVPGPGQAQNNFNSNADVSKELNLLSGNSSSIIRGNLLTLPIGGGLIYIQPVYVQSTGTTSFPLLKKVLVAFGDKVGFSDTLAGALNQVFGGNSGATTTTSGSEDGTTTADSTGGVASQASGQTANTSDSSNSGSDNAASDSASDSSGSGSSASTDDAYKKAKDSLDQAGKALDDAKKAIEQQATELCKQYYPDASFC